MTQQQNTRRISFFRKFYLVAVPILILALAIGYTEIRMANQSHKYPVLQEKLLSQQKQIKALEEDVAELEKRDERVKKILRKLHQYQRFEQKGEKSQAKQIGNSIGNLIKGLVF